MIPHHGLHGFFLDGHPRQWTPADQIEAAVATRVRDNKLRALSLLREPEAEQHNY
jgi:hypothetical protein